MRTLVTYYSQTENTKKIADAIYETLNGEKAILKLGDVQNLSDYDFIFIGFPIHKFGLPEKAKTFIEAHSKNKQIALFITHAMPSDAPALKSLLKKCTDAAPNADLSGLFHCRGELNKKIADFMLKSDDPKLKDFGRMREATIGHPDASEISQAKIFARDIMKKHN